MGCSFRFLLSSTEFFQNKIGVNSEIESKGKVELVLSWKPALISFCLGSQHIIAGEGVGIIDSSIGRELPTVVS